MSIYTCPWHKTFLFESGAVNAARCEIRVRCRGGHNVLITIEDSLLTVTPVAEQDGGVQ